MPRYARDTPMCHLRPGSHPSPRKRGGGVIARLDGLRRVLSRAMTATLVSISSKMLRLDRGYRKRLVKAGPDSNEHCPPARRNRGHYGGFDHPIPIEAGALQPGLRAGFTSLKVFADWQLVNDFPSRQREARWIVIEHRRCRRRSIVLAESDAGWVCQAGCEKAVAGHARRSDVGLVYDSALDPTVKVVSMAHQRLGFPL